MKFTEAKLEQAIIDLLGERGCSHVQGKNTDRKLGEVLRKPASAKIVHDSCKVKGEA